MILNISEASLHLGFRSRSTLQRLVQRGHLDGYRVQSDGREVLLQTEPPGQPSLRETVRALTQYRPGSPLWERHRPAAAAPLADLSDAELGAHCDQLMAGLDAALPELGPDGPDWQQVAEHLNAFLGRTWPAPPWDGDQAATVAMALELALEAAAGG